MAGFELLHGQNIDRLSAEFDDHYSLELGMAAEDQPIPEARFCSHYLSVPDFVRAATEHGWGVVNDTLLAPKNQVKEAEEFESRKGFECTRCGTTLCMACILKLAPIAPNGARACHICGGAFQRLVGSCLPVEDTIRPGESLIRVELVGDLKVGDLIRFWHPDLYDWVPGWWSEVLRIEGSSVFLRDLESGKGFSRAVTSSTWKHPIPDRVKSFCGAGKAAGWADLGERWRIYGDRDYRRSSDDELESDLRSYKLTRKILDLKLRGFAGDKGEHIDGQIELYDFLIKTVTTILTERRK